MAGAAMAATVCLGPAAGAAMNDEPFAASQWGLRQVGAERAWDRTRGRGARVGIVDTGVDLGHPELADRVVASTRCIGTGGQAARCTGSAQDDSGHGTHVAGIVAASLDGAGMVGVAPEASLLVVKVLQPDGAGEASDAAAGIDWLLGQGVDVVNLSLAEVPSLRTLAGSPLEAAIRRASAAGAVVVLAAGNDVEAPEGRTSLNQPSFNLPAIVVGASTRAGQLAPYSLPLADGVRWGLMAPGGDGSAGVQGEVVSTYWFAGRSNAYAWSEGTSMAAPHVAGAAALLAAQGVRGQAAVDRLLATAAPSDCGPGCRGLLDARAAVTAAPGRSPASVPTRASEAGPRPPTAPEPALPTVADVAPAPSQVAITPLDAPVALEVPDRRADGPQDLWAGVVAAVALVAVAAATARVGWRRLRAGAQR